MVADPGHMANMSEAHYFLRHARGLTRVPPHATLCADMLRGELLGSPVAIVTTGIGQRSAASCAASLLMLCPERVAEILLFGTAGCSVQRGGVLNSDDCSGANPTAEVRWVAPDAGCCAMWHAGGDTLACWAGVSTQKSPCAAPRSHPLAQITRIGDMCISPFALDGSCRVASWQQQAAGYPNVCSMPQETAG